MGTRAFKLILGLAVATVAAVLTSKGLGMLWAVEGGPGQLVAQQGPRALFLPIGMILGALAAAWAYYSAAFRQVAPFRAFRLVLGSAVGMLVLYFIADAALGVKEVFAAPIFKSDALSAPLMKFIVSAAIALAFYFALVAESGIRRVIENIFAIPELVKKLAFTLGLLCIYRIGFQIPLPGLDQARLSEAMQGTTGALGQAMEYFAMFTGGSLQKLTLFGLGIMPYISASIIFQLLVAVVPTLERLQKEGPAGYRKIQEYTRYATVGLCLVQGVVILMSMWRYFYPQYQPQPHVFVMGVAGLTCGTVFLMWLGEQIDEYGIGNGISLIIMAGIVSRMPHAIRELAERASVTVTGVGGQDIGLIKIIFLAASFVFVVAGSILISQAQRRIPIQQAKHTRGRRVYGGQRQYLPLRVNHGGVMPIIFASSLLLFPGAIFGWMVQKWPGSATVAFFSQAFSTGELVHSLCYVGLIFFFAYFWTTIQFRPKDMSDQLRDYGNFIPGLRPGRRTADYLERVMERITYCGAGFLAAIAVIPQVMAGVLDIPWRISAFLGGTGLLIMVSVALDVVQRIESNLIMRNYGGLLGDAGRIRGTR